MGIYVYSPRGDRRRVPRGRFDFPDLVLALLADGERVCQVRVPTTPGTTSGPRATSSSPSTPT